MVRREEAGSRKGGDDVFSLGCVWLGDLHSILKSGDIAIRLSDVGSQFLPRLLARLAQFDPSSPANLPASSLH